MKSRTIVAALAAPLVAAGALALSAGSASAATWQDTSIQVNMLHATAANPVAPAVAASHGKITVTRAGAADTLSVNSHASRLLRGMKVTISNGVVTLAASVGLPPATKPVPGFVV